MTPMHNSNSVMSEVPKIVNNSIVNNKHFDQFCQSCDVVKTLTLNYYVHTYTAVDPRDMNIMPTVFACSARFDPKTARTCIYCCRKSLFASNASNSNTKRFNRSKTNNQFSLIRHDPKPGGLKKKRSNVLSSLEKKANILGKSAKQQNNKNE